LLLSLQALLLSELAWSVVLSLQWWWSFGVLFAVGLWSQLQLKGYAL